MYSPFSYYNYNYIYIIALRNLYEKSNSGGSSGSDDVSLKASTICTSTDSVGTSLVEALSLSLQELSQQQVRLLCTIGVV